MKQILILLMAFANIQDGIDEYRISGLTGWGRYAAKHKIGALYPTRSYRTTTTTKVEYLLDGKWETLSNKTEVKMVTDYSEYNAWPNPARTPPDPNATMNRIKALIENDPNSAGPLKALLEVLK